MNNLCFIMNNRSGPVMPNVAIPSSSSAGRRARHIDGFIVSSHIETMAVSEFRRFSYRQVCVGGSVGQCV